MLVYQRVDPFDSQGRFLAPQGTLRNTQETRLDNIDLSNLPVEKPFTSEATGALGSNSLSFFGDHDFFGDASNSMGEVAQEKPLKLSKLTWWCFWYFPRLEIHLEVHYLRYPVVFV